MTAKAPAGSDAAPATAPPTAPSGPVDKTGWQPCAADDPGPAVLRTGWGLDASRAERLCRESVNDLWRFRTDRGEVILKALGQPTTAAWLDFQRAAGELAAEAGLPVPLSVPTPDGAPVAHHHGRQWQLRPYRPGQPFAPDSPAHLTQTARALNTLHRLPVTAFGHAPASPGDETAFWRAAGEESWNQLDRALAPVLTAPRRTNAVAAWRAVHQRAVAELDGAGYDTLPAVLTHGEVAGSNLVFDREGTLRALLDWDAVQLRPRAYDLAKAALFLGRIARGSLDIDPDRAATVVAGITGGQPLADREAAVLTPLLELYFVPTPDRLRRMAHTVPRHLDWYVHWTLDGARRARSLLDPVIRRLSGAGTS
ncbi:phosphotransferase [Streptomyces sp. NPDC006552]|uniref:phosphotransferase n=1 Tax=Streptomyces sp. NPDC006552 TaxID=3157179 RepID=UPI0033AA1DF9